MYPAQLRLERQGLAFASWESSASGLTTAGRESLARLSAQWDTFARDMAALTRTAQGLAR